MQSPSREFPNASGWLPSLDAFRTCLAKGVTTSFGATLGFTLRAPSVLWPIGFVSGVPSQRPQLADPGSFLCARQNYGSRRITTTTASTAMIISRPFIVTASYDSAAGASVSAPDGYSRLLRTSRDHCFSVSGRVLDTSQKLSPIQATVGHLVQLIDGDSAPCHITAPFCPAL